MSVNQPETLRHTPTPDPLKVLAMYLTDNARVVHTSIGLQVGGKIGAEAKAFYALRGAFNVTGYATQVEAEACIRTAVNSHERLTARVAELEGTLREIVGMAAKRLTDHDKCNCTVCKMRNVADAALSAADGK